MKKIFFTILFITALLTITACVQANDATLGRLGETVYPMSNNDVEMVSEDIFIDLQNVDGRIKGFVTCTFVFKNTSTSTDVLMGFPATLKIHEDGLTREDDVTLHNFTAYINGKKIDVSEVDGSQYEEQFSFYPKWFVFSVPFLQDEVITMTHTYDINFFNNSGGITTIGYVLETGATWKNNIGHSKITFNLPDVLPAGISFASYQYILSDFQYNGSQLIFEKSDFSPDFNILVDIDKHFMLGFNQATIRPADDLFAIGNTLSKEELIVTYNNIIKTNKLIETLYLTTLFGLQEESHQPIITGITIPGYSEYTSNEPFININIYDDNFDLLYPCQFILKDTRGIIIKEGKAKRLQYDQYGYQIYYHFGDFGTQIYQTHLSEPLVEGMTYSIIITCIDEAHNETIKTFTFIYHHEGSTLLFTNPKTGVKENLPILLLLSLLSLFILVHYKKSMVK